MKKIFVLLSLAALVACGGEKAKSDEVASVDANGNTGEADSESAVAEGLPFSGEEVKERVVLDFGNRAIRTDADASITHPEQVKNKKNCFIVMSKKDYYLYVYEAQGADTVMVARYDCAFGLKKGNKTGQGDMRTPHCTMAEPFSITAYGDWFLRLSTPGHKGIGIHGSTNNRESVPGRASEGCIRLKDEDIKDLRQNYAFEGMKVVIKGEEVDDLPFEIHAMTKQNVSRKRHFNRKNVLTNEQIEQAQTEPGRTAKGGTAAPERAEKQPVAASVSRVDQQQVSAKDSKNMTLEERQAQKK